MQSTKGLSRRQFLALAGGATASMALAACVAPAPGGSDAGGGDAPAEAPGSLHLLKWSSFIAPADELMKAEGAAWGEANNVEVQLETINNNDIPARIASAVQAGDGPDVIQQVDNWGHLFADSLMDVSDLAEEISDTLGGFYEDQVAYSKVDDTWRTIPWTIVGNSHVYRTDYFEEVLGRSEWGIDTWGDYIETAAAMKEGGYGFGQSAGHSFGDPVSFWYPFLWGHGGTEVNEDASEVTLSSEETVAAVTNALELVETGFVDGVAAWDDGSNNRSYLAGELASTLNGASIYFVANRDLPDIAEVSNHGIHPAGPAGRYSYQGGRSNGIMGYSSNADTAKAFLLHMTQPDFYDEWLITSEAYNVGVLNNYNESAVWEKDEKLLPFKEAIAGGTSRWAGWPGPPNSKAFDVRNNYVIVDLFAKAITGEMTAEESTEWAAGEIAKTYGL